MRGLSAEAGFGMVTVDSYSAAERYAGRADAVLTQRTCLRGPQAPGDLFAGLPTDHAMLKMDPRRPYEPNLAAIASYIEPDDVIVDVCGGAGTQRLSPARPALSRGGRSRPVGSNIR